MAKKISRNGWHDRKHVMWFPFSFEKYRIGNGRLYCQHGLFSRSEHECQFYRILDISLERKFSNLIFGTGTILMKTADSSDSYLVLKNIRHSKQVRDMISEMVEEAREEKGMKDREVRMTGGYSEDINGDGRMNYNDYL